jgi:serine protease AprX
MPQKYLITLTDPTQLAAIAASGAEILAEYPSAVLVRGEEPERQALEQAGLEFAAVAPTAIRIGPVAFAMSAAVAAEEAAPTAKLSNRRAYYLVQLVGPAKSEWLTALRATGARIYDSLPGDALLVGILDASVDELRQLPWVEAVTPYRPAMKISPRFRPQLAPAHQFNAVELAAAAPLVAAAAEMQQVEVTVFPNESTEEVASRLREQGGMVLRQSGESVAAIVPSSMIHEIAELPGVQAVVPHEFPKFTNDVAADIMGVPPDRTFDTTTLRGDGQIVAIADSGLDTGNAATIHDDFLGRVVQIKSLPVAPSFRPFANGSSSFDDGPADTHSAHGTHVAGSVLGNGARAMAAGSPVVPTGIAPNARVFFQAIEQRVNWRPPSATVPALPPVGLFGIPDDLAQLFDEAYQAGARIHTNSWGGPSKNRNGNNIAGIYTQDARELDGFAFTHQDMLILFSAGNDGEDEDGPAGGGDGVIDEDSIGSPGAAKNCLTIGASENLRPSGSLPAGGIDANWTAFQRQDGTLRFSKLTLAKHVSDNPEGLAAFSSRGPSDDGRIKPELVAPGTNVLSVRSSVFTPSPGSPKPLWGEVKAPDPLHKRYCFSGGTSMSTPLVAGAAAIVRQFLVDVRGHVKAGEKPSSALLKAVLINGAVAMKGQFPGEISSGPNPACGFGRVNLAAALEDFEFDDDETSAVGTGEMRVYDLTVRNATRPFAITMAWTDAPSAVNFGGLSNRLYLQLVTPGGVVRDGDVSAFPNAVNNVQQIRVPVPETGTYKIRVRGVTVVKHSPIVTSLDRPKQNFALVVSNAATLLRV